MENNNRNYDNEIDLGQVKQKVQGYMGSLNDRFFDLILFIKRNFIIILTIFIIGAGLGTYLDIKSKTYLHKVFVTPNFNSVDFLYEQVDRISSKISKNDEEFINSIGIKDARSLKSIKVEPIVDIYNFIEDTDGGENRKIDIFKIMSDNGGVDKVIEDRITSKNYQRHLITITTNKQEDEKLLVEPLLKFLNSNPYFLLVQQKSVKSLQDKIRQNDSIVLQIDRVVEGFSKESRKSNESLLYYNDNTNISDLLNLKNYLIKEQAKNMLNEIDYEMIVKDNAVINNIPKTDGLSGKMKLLVPAVFLLAYAIIIGFKRYYRRQLVKRNL